MTTDFATLEERIRAEAERKIDVAKQLATAQRTLLAAREEFARTDAENLKAVKAATDDARAAGFTETELKSLGLLDTPTPSRGARQSVATRRKPGTRRSSSAPGTQPRTAASADTAPSDVHSTFPTSD